MSYGGTGCQLNGISEQDVWRLNDSSKKKGGGGLMQSFFWK